LEQLSTSPAASILQLNYPLNGAVQLPNAPTQMSLSSSSACLSTSLSGSISHPPFVNPQNIKRSLDCVPMSRAVNNFNKAATTKSSFLTRCPTTSVVGRSFPVVTCGSMAPVGPHVPLTVPVGVKSSSQAIIKIGSSSGRTDLLTRYWSSPVIGPVILTHLFVQLAIIIYLEVRGHFYIYMCVTDIKDEYIKDAKSMNNSQWSAQDLSTQDNEWVMNNSTGVVNLFL